MSEAGYIILFLVFVVLGSSYGILSGNIKEWLKYAVAMAEKNYGSGVGQLKLREVYNMFVAQFPAVAKFLPFSIFSKWVDLALEWLKSQLEQNKALETVIKN